VGLGRLLRLALVTIRQRQQPIVPLTSDRAENASRLRGAGRWCIELCGNEITNEGLNRLENATDVLCLKRETTQIDDRAVTVVANMRRLVNLEGPQSRGHASAAPGQARLAQGSPGHRQPASAPTFAPCGAWGRGLGISYQARPEAAVGANTPGHPATQPGRPCQDSLTLVCQRSKSPVGGAAGENRGALVVSAEVARNRFLRSAGRHPLLRCFAAMESRRLRAMESGYGFTPRYRAFHAV